MKILVADDDGVSRLLIETLLQKWGFTTVMASNGKEAWEIIDSEESPNIAILDWMMPEIDGIEICQRLSERSSSLPYVILFTVRGASKDIVTGLEAGANDYVTKPFDYDELRARIQVAVRVVSLQLALSHQVQELQEALTHIRKLQSILPICSYCRKIRDDKDYWHSVESYITEHTDSTFSHSICPDCFNEIVVPLIEECGHDTGERKIT